MSDAPGAVLVSGGGVVVRYATLADVPAVVAEAGRYVANVLSGTLSQSAFELEPFVTVQAAGAHADSRLLVAEMAGTIVGVLSVAAVTHPATHVRWASDLFWWMAPPLPLRARVGIRLLEAFEDWAARRRAPLLLVTSADDRSDALFTAEAFTGTRAWARRVSP